MTERTVRRLVISVPSLAFLGTNIIGILYFLWACVPVHQSYRELVSTSGWDIPARSRTLLSIPSPALVGGGILLLALLLAKEWALKSPVVALILNVLTWFVLSALFWVWIDAIQAIQAHVMAPR